VSSQETVRKVAQDATKQLPAGRLLEIRSVLADGFVAGGSSRFEAEELAERWADRCAVYLDAELSKAFDELGVPRSMVESTRAGTYLTFRHRGYITYLPNGLREEVESALVRIRGCSDKDLLAVASGILAGLGCDPIVITDGPADGGVDVAGMLANQPGHGLVVLIQAKALSGLVSGRVVREEYGVFSDSSRSGKLAELIALLHGGKTNRVGSAHAYIFCSTNGFSASAQEAANRLQVGLHYPIQLAHWITLIYGPRGVEQVITACQPIRRDLSRNLARPLREIMVNILTE
jgi:Restriction endonuclease